MEQTYSDENPRLRKHYAILSTTLKQKGIHIMSCRRYEELRSCCLPTIEQVETIQEYLNTNFCHNMLFSQTSYIAIDESMLAPAFFVDHCRADKEKERKRRRMKNKFAQFKEDLGPAPVSFIDGKDHSAGFMGINASIKSHVLTQRPFKDRDNIERSTRKRGYMLVMNFRLHKKLSWRENSAKIMNHVGLHPPRHPVYDARFASESLWNFILSCGWLPIMSMKKSSPKWLWSLLDSVLQPDHWIAVSYGGTLMSLKNDGEKQHRVFASGFLTSNEPLESMWNVNIFDTLAAFSIEQLQFFCLQANKPISTSTTEMVMNLIGVTREELVDSQHSDDLVDYEIDSEENSQSGHSYISRSESDSNVSAEESSDSIELPLPGDYYRIQFEEDSGNFLVNSQIGENTFSLFLHDDSEDEEYIQDFDASTWSKITDLVLLDLEGWPEEIIAYQELKMMNKFQVEDYLSKVNVKYLKKALSLLGVEVRQYKRDIVGDFVEYLFPSCQLKKEVEDLMFKLHKYQHPNSEVPPQHYVYSDNFNSLDLANKIWYKISYPHPIQCWTARLMDFMLRFAIDNAWIISEMIKPISLPDFRREYAENILKK